MEVLNIQFTAHRFHATPWDAHVNEGRIEWPPCAWRILRALIAVGYNKYGWTTGPPDTAVSMIKKLAECNPAFSLPIATETHTRHYMPSRSGSAEKPVKVFDSFLRFSNSDESLLIRYDVDLDNSEREELSQLADGLAYLGRAESWIEANLLTEEHIESLANREWCQPANESSPNRVRLLAPLSDGDFQQWRDQAAMQAADEAEANAQRTADEKNKKLTPAAKKKARTKAESWYPRTLIESLQQDTSSWQSAGWPRPPGSRWIDYAVPQDSFDRRPLTTLSPTRKFQKPEAVLLAIDGEGKQGTLRPQMKRALPLMELIHSEAVRHAAELKLGHLPELTGTNFDGSPLRSAHTHAHWIPLSLSQQGAIDHVLVYASQGISREGVQAISAIRWAYAKGIRALSVNMVGQGSIGDIHRQLATFPDIDPLGLSVIGQSKVWTSATPLVLRKYLHKRGKKTATGQISEELQERGFPKPSSITLLTQQEMVERNLKGFVLRRKPNKQQPPVERSWGTTIQFEEPVEGLTCLGYASHFGLGLFRAL